MNKTIVIAILAAAFFGLLGGCAQAQVRTEDEEAIRRGALDRIERFNRHDVSNLTSSTPDVDFVNVHGMWFKGAAELERGMKQRTGTALKEAKITLIDLRIRFVRPDVAIVHQTHEMNGMLDSEGKKMPPHQELNTRVLVKEQGKWLTTAFHNTIVRPVETPVREK